MLALIDRSPGLVRLALVGLLAGFGCAPRSNRFAGPPAVESRDPNDVESAPDLRTDSVAPTESPAREPTDEEVIEALLNPPRDPSSTLSLPEEPQPDWDPRLPHCDDFRRRPPCHIEVKPSWQHQEESKLLLELDSFPEGRLAWTSRNLDYYIDDPGTTYCIDVSRLSKAERRQLLIRIQEAIERGKVEHELDSVDAGPPQPRPGENCRTKGPAEFEPL